MKVKARIAPPPSRSADVWWPAGAVVAVGRAHGVNKSDEPSGRRIQSLLGILTLALLLSLIGASLASADTSIETPGEAIAVSSKEGGDLYVTTRYSAIVEQLTPAGTLVRSFDPSLESSQAIAVDNSCAQQVPPKTGVECEVFDPSYGDIFVTNARRYRIEKYSPTGELFLMFGGEVDKSKVQEREEEEADSEPVTVTAKEEDVCAVASGDTCGEGVPGTGPSHFYNGGYPLEWGGGGTSNQNSMAVGPDGTVYVGDYGRIQEFKPNGAFSGELKLEDSEKQFVVALAVDASGNVFERSAVWGNTGSNEGFLSQIPGVREYGPGPLHPYIRTFDTGPEEAGSEPTHIATDAAGDLFVSDANGSLQSPPTGELLFRAFKPNGTLYAEFTSDQLTKRPQGGAPASTNGIGIGNEAEKLYASSYYPEPPHIAVHPLPQSGPPLVGEEHVTNIEPETATLHGFVNPRGFDTEYRFEYISRDAFEADGNGYGVGTETTTWVGLGPVNREDPVQSAISALHPDTSYHFRLVAKNHCNEADLSEVCETTGTDETLETLPPVSIRDFTTQTVGPELVTLRAELNPNGQASTYTIHYGTNTGYVCESGHTCTASGTLAIGNDFVKVMEGTKDGVTFTGLKSNTTYHYQIEVENGYGSYSTPDQTFTTEVSSTEERSLEDCPANGTVHGEPSSTIREENESQRLPDCRAYEQASEKYKGGSQVGTPSNISLAPGGERAGYLSDGAFAGAANNELATQYEAERTEAGWVTHAVVQRAGPPPYEPLADFGLFSPELDRWIYKEGEGNSLEEAVENQASSFYTMGSADGSSIFRATPVIAPIEGGARFVYDFMSVPQDSSGMSNDLSRLYLPTGAKLLAEDPRPDNDQGVPGHPVGDTGIPPEADRIYEISGAGGPSPILSLAAEVPSGLPNGRTEGCLINTAVLSRPGGASRMTSEDGSMLFYTAPVEEVPTGECGEGQPNPIGLFACNTEAGSCVPGVSGYHPPLQLNAPPPSQCTAPHPCASAAATTPIFDGASGDGRRVWFTTKQPLVDSDTDTTNDLYVAELSPSGELEELVLASEGEATASHPTPGNGADVGEDGWSANQGVVRVSADGTHAAFVSPAVLTSEPNALGLSAVQHANNLFVYDAVTEKIKFVVELCSGPQQSGTEPGPNSANSSGNGHFVTTAESVPDSFCPASASNFYVPESSGGDEFALWAGGNGGEAAMTPDGTFLLFYGVGRFTRDDTDNQGDIFRYNFETGELVRISLGRRGNDGGGNDDSYNAEFAGGYGLAPSNELFEDATRTISADGSTVIFRTAAPLVSYDTNKTSSVGGCDKQVNFEEKHTGCDIYEWEAQGHDTCTEAGGCVSLISSGHAPNVGDTAAVISSSGRDIIFSTTRGLSPNDLDGVTDIYDARVDGGFHPEHPGPVCTSPEACGEQLAATPPSPNATTAQFVGPGNSTTHLKCAKGKHRVKKHGEFRCVSNRRHRKKVPRKHHGHRGKHHQRDGGHGKRVSRWPSGSLERRGGK